MNWTIIIIVGIAVITLVIFLIRQNDEKSLERSIKNDYTKPKEREGGDIDVEEILK